MGLARKDDWVSSCDWVPEDISSRFTVVPAEHVTLHVVDLPIRSARQRRAALRYALEETVGASLDTLHFAICETRKDGKLLAAVVSRDIMDAALTARPDTPVLAEQFLLEVDPEGSAWRTHRQGDRVLVRLSDGTGFALQSDALPPLWQRAGKPPLIHSGDGLPDTFNAVSHDPDDRPLPSDLAMYDLRQGPYRPALGIERPLKALAASVVLAAAGHLGLTIADVRAQTAIADTLQQEAASVLQVRLPAASPDDDPISIKRQINADAVPVSGSGFLPLMNDISTTWVRDGATIDVRQLTWSNDGLRLLIEAPSLEALQGAEASLVRAGLTVSSGSATADAGSARAEFVVRR